MPFIILTAVISIGVAIFAIQNAMSVHVNFFIWHGDASLVLVILGSFLAGILVATFYLLMVKARHFLATKKLEDEIYNLKIATPILITAVKIMNGIKSSP